MFDIIMAYPTNNKPNNIYLPISQVTERQTGTAKEFLYISIIILYYFTSP